jgi:hypothetical protein
MMEGGMERLILIGTDEAKAFLELASRGFGINQEAHTVPGAKPLKGPDPLVLHRASGLAPGSGGPAGGRSNAEAETRADKNLDDSGVIRGQLSPFPGALMAWRSSA